jgi:hypothetical protein
MDGMVSAADVAGQRRDCADAWEGYYLMHSGVRQKSEPYRKIRSDFP